MKARYAVVLALLATGCTTAGPFVTSISSDGRGNLVIEKSMVKFDAFMGTVSNQESTTTTIKLLDLESPQNAGRPGNASAQPIVITGHPK